MRHQEPMSPVSKSADPPTVHDEHVLPLGDGKRSVADLGPRDRVALSLLLCPDKDSARER